MSDDTPLRAPVRPITPLKTSTASVDDTVCCEHCAASGYKTDCCGW